MADLRGHAVARREVAYEIVTGDEEIHRLERKLVAFPDDAASRLRLAELWHEELSKLSAQVLVPAREEIVAVAVDPSGEAMAWVTPSGVRVMALASGKVVRSSPEVPPDDMRGMPRADLLARVEALEARLRRERPGRRRGALRAAPGTGPHPLPSRPGATACSSSTRSRSGSACSRGPRSSRFWLDA